MRKFSKEEFSTIALQNPLLEIVANITAKHTGVTVEEMKDKRNSHHIVAARIIYANICRSVVFPQYYIPYFLNRHDSALRYWYSMYDILFDTDIAFAMLMDKVRTEFNNKLKTLKDV